MTVSKDHPLPKPKMLEIMKATKMKDLYFVVPNTIYDDFPLQRLDEPTRKNKSNSERKLHQYALKINLQ